MIVQSIIKDRMLLALALAALATPSPAQTPAVQLNAGFTPVRMAATLHAEDGLGTMENDCIGYVQRAPLFEFDVPADGGPAVIEVRLESGTDTVLAVVQPHERNWGGGMPGPEYCSDDEGGGVNPAVVIRDPKPGRYEVLAGAHERGLTADVVLTVRERPTP